MLPPELQTGILIAGDVDRDGDVDLLGHTDALWLNDGNGYFTVSPQRLPISSPALFGSSPFFDADGDNDLDVICYPISSTGPIRHYPPELLLGDGAGRFQRAPQGALPAVPRQDLPYFDLLDFDGDGNTDVWFGTNRLWRGDGRGRFTDVTTQLLAAPLPGPMRIVAADFDLDGDIDLVAHAKDTGDLYLEQDRGVFRARPDLLPTHDRGSDRITAVDHDGDGDFDLLRTHDGRHGERSHLWINRLRQLRIPRLPRTGGTLELELTQDPGHLAQPMPVLLLFATQRLPTPVRLGPFGSFALDPATLQDLGVQQIPAPSGQLLLSVPIPASPTLQGLELHLQHVFLDRTHTYALRLGNLASAKIAH